MINIVSGIDHFANTGRTPWHRASALAKLVLAAGLLGLAVFAPSLRLLVAVHAVAWMLALTSRVPVRLLAVAVAYPLLFLGFFVVASWDGTWRTPLVLALRPLTAGLAAVWLVATTPYPDLFAPLSRILPRRVGDGLFLTYRALFQLIGRLERLWRSLRLRGGGAGPARRRMSVAGHGLGTVVLYGFERGQRQYQTMLMRGHGGRVCGCRHWAEMSSADLYALAAAALVAALAFLLWRAP